METKNLVDLITPNDIYAFRITLSMGINEWRSMPSPNTPTMGSGLKGRSDTKTNTPTHPHTQNHADMVGSKNTDLTMFQISWLGVAPLGCQV